MKMKVKLSRLTGSLGQFWEKSAQHETEKLMETSTVSQLEWFSATLKHIQHV